MVNHDAIMESEQLLAKVREATDILEAIAEDRRLLADVDEELRTRFLIAAGRVSRPDRVARKALSRARLRGEKRNKKNADQLVLDRTGIRRQLKNPIFHTPRNQARYHGTTSQPIGDVSEERACYACQKPYTRVHFFYDQMCLECGDFNHAKRSQTADLSGRVALITGSRVKIGYQAAILMLRSGCRVICLTRFPKDAARRYAAEEDFADWADRLEIHGIDLRHTPSVEALCANLKRTHDRLDFLINNACQTVRRPPGFYDHLMKLELGSGGLSADERRLVGHLATGSAYLTAPGSDSSASLSQVELLPEDSERGIHLFPKGELDADLQQVDLRRVNSWRLKLAEVPAIELLEVHLVNAVAPFILNARLKPLMVAVPTRDKHIVNVSAMEGQFYRSFKTDRHPHTNMAKASLNMMTRTSAPDYHADGIHMNSVDTGWVTDEDPIEHAETKRRMHRFHPPLDIVDGAARIVDPILSGLNSGVHVWGQFLKDYRITDW